MPPTPTDPPSPSPEPPDPRSDEQRAREQKAAEAAAARDDDRADPGCLILLGMLFAAIFFAPVVLLMGGAPLIIPLLILLLLTILTPLVNPAEKKPGRTRWIGRLITFAVMAALVAIGVWILFGTDFAGGRILRE